jgi:hypothetical protein
MKLAIISIALGTLLLAGTPVANAAVRVSIGVPIFGYPAPPVVYQPSPYYGPPPVVYVGGGAWGGDRDRGRRGGDRRGGRRH